MAQELAGRTRTWLERAAERLAPERGLFHAEGVGRSDSATDRQDLAARMRAAWEARQSRGEYRSDRDHASEPARSLAERMREAAQGIDREALRGALPGCSRIVRPRNANGCRRPSVSRSRNACESAKSATTTGTVAFPTNWADQSLQPPTKRAAVAPKGKRSRLQRLDPLTSLALWGRSVRGFTSSQSGK